MSIVIRPAQQDDVNQIVQMVNRFAAQNIMLPRSEENVRQTIADWLVAVEVQIRLPADSQMCDLHNGSHHYQDTDQSYTISKIIEPQTSQHEQGYQTAPEYFAKDQHAYVEQRIVGCGALVPLNDTLAEVRSLAVDESQHGNGLGSTLVIELVNMARERGYAQLCALTLRPKFFIRLGFDQVDRWSISPKVWQACIYCPKFHRCDEVAVLMNLAITSATADERNRQPAWNHLLKWREWQPLRLAYRYEYQEEQRTTSQAVIESHNH